MATLLERLPGIGQLACATFAASLAGFACTGGEVSGEPARRLVEVSPDSVAPKTTPAPAPDSSVPEGPAAPAVPASPPGACPDDMVYISAGTFTMGDDEGLRQAKHQVTLSAYCIDRTEVTQAAYKRCLAARACAAPSQAAPGCNDLSPSQDLHPVNCVNWVQANAYCRWAKKRLPTEAEWEYAALGSEGRLYAWGNNPEVPPYREGVTVDWAGGTVPVGSRPGDVSPFGMLDMGESVTEWVADWSAPYEATAQVNPRGPETGRLRVRRGDNYGGTAVGSAHRRAGHPIESAMGEIGLRCARAVSAARKPR